MPSVLLNVHNWNPDQQNILKINNGGHNPHITLFHTSVQWPTDFLVDIGSATLKSALADKYTFTLTPENVKLNSFYHERSGKTRYDVLIHLDSDGAKYIEDLREIVRKTAPPTDLEKLNMRTPHITDSIHWDEESAQAALNDLKSQLPIQVNIQGLTI